MVQGRVSAMIQSLQTGMPSKRLHPQNSTRDVHINAKHHIQVSPPCRGYQEAGIPSAGLRAPRCATDGFCRLFAEPPRRVDVVRPFRVLGRGAAGVRVEQSVRSRAVKSLMEVSTRYDEEGANTDEVREERKRERKEGRRQRRG